MKIGSIFWALLVVLLVLAATEQSALAQGCAMCKANLDNSASAAQEMKVINTAVLALLLPPVAIMGVILRVAYRYRGSRPPVAPESPADAAPTRAQPRDPQ